MRARLGRWRKARAVRAQLAGAPVPAGWAEDAVETQGRLAAGRVRSDAGVVFVPVGRFEIAGFTASSLAFLHHEIFVRLQYYFRSARPDPVILDGGSNVGMSVLFFKALYPAARIVAFEPAQPAFGLLARNVEANGLQDVELHPVALGAERGEVRFYDEPDDPATFRMSTRADRLPDPRETTVEQRRLSEFVTEGVDLVKLDVEGAEREILEDLVETGAIARVERIVVEYHHHLAPGEDGLGGFLELLGGQGFGYQVSAREPIARRAAGEPAYQDVLVYAYRRNSPSS